MTSSSISQTAILEAISLKKSYGKQQVVQDLSFSIYPGEVVGLLGANGAGKTTAFYMTMGLISPDGGQVIFNHQDITYAPIHRRAKAGLGYLSQEPSIFRELSVANNLLCILETLPLLANERVKRMNKLLGDMNLQDLANKKAAFLSGGERRRLELSKALILEPKLLLLDEPFANIDPLSIMGVKSIIGLLKQKGISVLITDHNARELLGSVDRCYLLHEGKSVFQGGVEELLNNTIAKKCYLGEEFVL